jgi:hypothetical protein
LASSSVSAVDNNTSVLIMPRTRFTDLFFTVDTHVPATETDADKVLAGQLRDIVVRQMYTRAALSRILIPENPAAIKKVTLTGFSVEHGTKYNRIHCHFNLSIEHQTTLYLKDPRDDERTINRTTMAWFDEQLEPITGRKCYASVRLSDSSRAKNYAVKHGQSVEGFRATVDRGSTKPASVAASKESEDDDE